MSQSVQPETRVFSKDRLSAERCVQIGSTRVPEAPITVTGPKVRRIISSHAADLLICAAWSSECSAVMATVIARRSACVLARPGKLASALASTPRDSSGRATPSTSTLQVRGSGTNSGSVRQYDAHHDTLLLVSSQGEASRRLQRPHRRGYSRGGLVRRGSWGIGLSRRMPSQGRTTSCRLARLSLRASTL